MPKDTSDILGFVSSAPLFKNLDRAIVARLSAGARLRKFSKGEEIFYHGDKAEHYFIIRSGWVKVYRQTQDGKEAVAAIAGAGEVFGVGAFFEDSTYPFNAEAVEDSEVAILNSSSLRSELQNNSRLALNLLESYSQHNRELETKLEHVALMSAPQRIACFLLHQCRSGKEERAEVKLPVDKSLIATFLGMKPETFSRALKQLKNNGVRAAGSTIKVESIKSLESFTCVSCADAGECRRQGAESSAKS